MTRAAADDGTFLLPRGRYGVEMYGSFFRMHGNMYDYKIMYSDVERFILFTLESPRSSDTKTRIFETRARDAEREETL